MSMNPGRTDGPIKTGVLTGALAFLLMAVSVAWACTPAASIQASISAGAPGTRVVVTGNNFNPQAPVEIRWNSATGALLGQADGPSFSVPVTIPNESPSDVFFIVALQRELDQDQNAMGFSGKTQATFQVVDARPGASESTPATASDLWNGFSQGPDNSFAPSEASADGVAGEGAPAAGIGLALLAAGASGTLFSLIALALRKRRGAISS